MNAKEIIKKGLLQLQTRRENYEKFQRYYDGAHDLAFATAKFKKAFGDLFNLSCSRKLSGSLMTFC